MTKLLMTKNTASIILFSIVSTLLFTQCKKEQSQTTESPEIKEQEQEIEVDSNQESALEIIGEGFGYTAYLQYLEERKEGVMPKTALWLSYNNEEKVKILESNFAAEPDWEHIENKAKKYPIDQVYNVLEVHFLKNSKDNQVYMIMEGNVDYINQLDYIAPASLNIDSVLLIPVFDGFEGYNESDNTLTFRCRGYMDGVGRYMKKYKYDFNGRQISTDRKMYNCETDQEI